MGTCVLRPREGGAWWISSGNCGMWNICIEFDSCFRVVVCRFPPSWHLLVLGQELQSLALSRETLWFCSRRECTTKRRKPKCSPPRRVGEWWHSTVAIPATTCSVLNQNNWITSGEFLTGSFCPQAIEEILRCLIVFTLKMKTVASPSLWMVKYLVRWRALDLDPSFDQHKDSSISGRYYWVRFKFI